MIKRGLAVATFSRLRPADTLSGNENRLGGALLRPFDSAAAQSSIFDALVEAARRHGPRKPILEDQERNPLT